MTDVVSARQVFAGSVRVPVAKVDRIKDHHKQHPEEILALAEFTRGVCRPTLDQFNRLKALGYLTGDHSDPRIVDAEMAHILRTSYHDHGPAITWDWPTQTAD